jgi:NAD(P)-dependent dehydrogenase (short-subunit alcohol dehydrogenase family)
MNRVALVTGVGPGLGAALVRRFAREGFQVGFIEALASEISATEPRAVGVVADVGHPAEAAAAVKQVRAKLGPIGVLIHNAGSAHGGGLLGTTPEVLSIVRRRHAFPSLLHLGQAKTPSPTRHFLTFRHVLMITRTVDASSPDPNCAAPRRPE